MADISSQSEPLPAPHTNGLDGISLEQQQQQRPADIDADMREMERRKRVELIMNSRLFREELERIIETQMKDGGAGTSHLLQQISDMMGVPKHANVFKGSNCVIPINDIRGVESMGYAKGEKLLRCKLAAVYRLLDLYGWGQGVSNLVTARLNQDQEHFLVNSYGMLCHEITASSLVKIDMQGNVVEQGTTNFGVNVAAFSLHAAIHAARPDVKCAIHVHSPAVMAVSALKCGLLPISQESVVIGDVSTHPYSGGLAEPEEREKVARNLGPINKVLLLANHGAVCCGETVEEAFFNVYNTILACETQLKLMPVGVDNFALVSEETRKQMCEAARRAPDGTTLNMRVCAAEPGSALADKLAERKWRVGGVEFEALMRMLDNAGFRTGYIYRNPLIKGDPPRPRNDLEVPPAVSSLEEEEMYKQGIWKPGRKGNERTRWFNSPNVYQKVEILETGTPDPKKITKWVDANADEWVADGSPTHSSTPVKIDAALQFVPKNTNPKEFKLLQQQIKDNRRANKISAGPQSHILEGVTWEEVKKMQDAGVTQTGDQVVVVGAASKGIIQRGFQHHAMVYKTPSLKNPLDSVTDEEVDEYNLVIEKKAKGEYDTEFSESEGLSSAQISKQVDELNLRSPTSATSETEEESRDEPRVLRIETKQAPKPSQSEVVLSDDDENANANMLLLNAERHQALQTAVVNSSQKYKGPRTYRGTGVPRYYRTNSFAGMPRGRYLFYIPVHYHILPRTLDMPLKTLKDIHERKHHQTPRHDRIANFCVKEMQTNILFIRCRNRHSEDSPETNNNNINEFISDDIDIEKKCSEADHVNLQQLETEFELLDYNVPVSSVDKCRVTGSSIGDSILKSFREISQGYDKIIAEHESSASTIINYEASLLPPSHSPCVEKVRRLSAPADIRPLSPIIEEPRRSLLRELSQCEDVSSDPTSDNTNPIDTQTVTLSSKDSESEETSTLQSVSSNIFFESLQDLNDFSSTSTTTGTSTTQDVNNKARRRIIFQNEVTFVRKPDVKTDYDTARTEQTIYFMPTTDENLLENIPSLDGDDFDSSSYISANSLAVEPGSTDEGNWMGYEAARF